MESERHIIDPVERGAIGMDSEGRTPAGERKRRFSEGRELYANGGQLPEDADADTKRGYHYAALTFQVG